MFFSSLNFIFSMLFLDSREDSMNKNTLSLRLCGEASTVEAHVVFL